MNLETSYFIILLRLFLSVLLGGIIGFEREVKNRPAGLRTHVLVCVGASTIMIMSQLLFQYYYINYDMKIDPSRMGAQVVSGIGFLGAGTIMRHNSSIRGLTTAASIWAVGCIGLSTGAGLYILSISTTLMIIICLVIFSNITTTIDKISVICEVFIEMENKKAVGEVTLYLSKNNIKILDIEYVSEIESEKLTKKINIRMVLKIPPNTYFYQVIEDIEKISGVRGISHK